MLPKFSSASVTGLNNNDYQISRGQVMSSCFFVFFFFLTFLSGVIIYSFKWKKKMKLPPWRNKQLKFDLQFQELNFSVGLSETCNYVKVDTYPPTTISIF